MICEFSMKTIGVIGLGSIGARHARNLKTLGYRVIGHDPVIELTKDGVLYCPKAETVFASADAIIIAGPTELHSAHILAARGKPTFSL